MTAEQQLERSVLEGKERDELSAIAQAMSLKTTTRTKKADIIDRILDATGVTSNGVATNGESANGDSAHGDGNGTKAARRPRAAVPAVSEAEGSTASETESAQTPAASAPRDPGPAVFVEPPELSDGTEPSTAQQNGQGASAHQQANRSRPHQGQNQNNRNSQNNNQNNNSQGDGGDLGNRRGRRRRGRERGTGGELQGGGGQEQPYSGEMVDVKGMLDLRDEGYGFLRCGGYLPSPKDVYISISQARRFALRKGDYVEGACRPASNNEKYPALLRIDTVSGLRPRRGAQPPPLRGSDPAVPGLPAAPRDGRSRRQGQPDRPDRRPPLAHRQGAARADRVATQGRQDDGDEADRPLH